MCHQVLRQTTRAERKTDTRARIQSTSSRTSRHNSQRYVFCPYQEVVEKGIDTKQPVWPDKFNEIQYNNPKGK
jgi:hypothetical protein